MDKADCLDRKDDNSFESRESVFAEESQVTEQSKKLSQSETMLKALFEYANDGILIIDSDGVIIDANKRACEMHGFDKEDMIGANIEKIETSKNRNIYKERMERLLKGESLIFETEHLKKDGSKIAVEVSSKAIDVDGVMMIQSFQRDITEKRKLQAQLLHFQKMESIGTLAEGIAHEFKNTLTVILSFSEIILQDASISPDTANYMSIIEKSAQKASHTVSQLLSFARKDSFEPVPFSINTLIDDVLSMLSKLIQKNIVITKEQAVSVPYVVGDIIQIEQVVMNLIVNAKDAMPDGGEIKIKTGVVAIGPDSLNIPAAIRSGRYVNITFSDAGSGISDEHLPHIFEPFYTTKEKGQGTGMGLAIVYGIIKEHGGYITVDSRAGQGTVFNIYLPASRKRAIPADSRDLSEFKGPETILVVDDEIAVMEPIRKALLDNGYNVLVYNNPLRSLEFFRTNAKIIDAVVTDIYMPEMDGFELIENFKKIKPETMIIVMTGFNVGDKGAGVDGFLKKPFKASEMVSLLNDLLEKNPKHD